MCHHENGQHENVTGLQKRSLWKKNQLHMQAGDKRISQWRPVIADLAACRAGAALSSGQNIITICYTAKTVYSASVVKHV